MDEERAAREPRNAAKRYIESCRKDFWGEVFQAELDYLVRHLEGCRDVLSVGCGPAVIEGGLAERGFNVTGLDVLRQALDQAPSPVRTVEARAEDMPFPGSSFDAVTYVASLQFIEDYRKALEKSAFVLRPNGRIIVLLLNPGSGFFKEKLREPGSYMRKIRHTDLKEMEDAVAGYFNIRTEYFLGVEDDTLFESRDAADAVLYVILGTRKPA